MTERTESCESCRFRGVKYKDTVGGMAFYFCQRNPPYIPCRKSESPIAGFPVVLGADWCGEYKEKRK